MRRILILMITLTLLAACSKDNQVVAPSDEATTEFSPERVAYFFMESLRDKDLGKATEQIHPDDRATFTRDFLSELPNLPPVPNEIEIEVQIDSMNGSFIVKNWDTTTQAREQLKRFDDLGFDSSSANIDPAIDLVFKDERWWITK